MDEAIDFPDCQQIERWLKAATRQLDILGDPQEPDEVRNNAATMLYRCVGRVLKEIPDRYCTTPE